ncbi:MAG: hypothetical protein RMJ59_01450 [Candidatus Nitrosocaldus sp.]|nr:hypothetical protein [Candidatus Nitrosocaldus sp.]MDW8275030.1 hypothetical protein [Candidatus Nitrosocaldus sp.]
MDRLIDMLKGYYARECRMNRVYCSILQGMSSDDEHDHLLVAVINYLMLDTYKNLSVLGDILSRVGDGGISTLAVDRTPVYVSNGDGRGRGNMLDLLSSVLRMEKGLSQNLAHDCCYDEDDIYDDDNLNDGPRSSCPAPIGYSNQLRSHIRSVLRCISIDIEERLNILSSLTRATNATIFCACGYELPRMVSVDVQKGCTCSRSRTMMMLTIHCPRCGRTYHNVVDTHEVEDKSGIYYCYT